MIRPLEQSDIPKIRAIYAHYVEHSEVTYEEIVPTLEEFTTRINQIIQTYPYYVHEENGEILGYAYATIFRTRVSYRHSVEVSVYVDKDHFKKGIGKSLYQVLLPELKKRGFHTAIGALTLPNDASVKLHEQFGFEKVAHFKEVGFKFEKWWDTGFWQLMFKDPDA